MHVYKLCCAGLYDAIPNTSLAEQKNSMLAQLARQVSYMRQTTFMFYLRWYLYKLNQLQRKSNAGQSFWPHRA